MGATRRLILVWLTLAGLTLAGVPLGHADDPRPLGLALTAALLLAAFAKSALLLNDYLGLKDAPSWNAGLRAIIFALLATLGALAAFARLA